MDPRRARTHHRLQAALRQLLGRARLADLSVGALAEAAGVTRQTFYANYGGIDDLLLEYLEGHLVELERRHEESELSLALDDLEDRLAGHVEAILMDLDREDPRLRVILDGQSGLDAEGRFARLLERVMLRGTGTSVDRAKARFYSGAFLGTLRYWVFDPEAVPAAELARIFARLAVRGRAGVRSDSVRTEP